mmetsp:Transcript_18047/g.25008  ORF Transcript_18047/g.25008 Transcript_18047/m.25008 type:complete len:114 (-) Transcript_18047:192-533(-)
MALRMMADKALGVASTYYKRTMNWHLAQSGLRYEDLLIEETKDVKEALDLADPDVVTGRSRRLRRAVDLSYKRKSLQDYAPDMKLEPFKEEIYPDLIKIRERDEEYAVLNAHK